jgi:hypothetical protein
MFRLLHAAFLALTFATFTPAYVQQTVSVAEGNTRVIDRGRLTVKFVEIVEDSRCAKGMTCVWAGNAKIKLSVAKGKMALRTVELNSNTGQKTIKISGYQITLVSLTERVPDHLDMPQPPFIARLSIKKMR